MEAWHLTGSQPQDTGIFWQRMAYRDQGKLMASCKNVLRDPSKPFVVHLLFCLPVRSIIFIKY